MGIAASAVVAQRFHSRDADGEFGQAFAPGTAETVGDDDRESARPVRFLNSRRKFGGGAVGIFGKQQRVLAAVDVGNIDAAVGAEKAVTGSR